jgi:hypothetical protein
MRHEARFASAVPHRTAFLPPSVIATLPPMHEASAEVGSTANTNPFSSAASITRLVTTPAPQRMTGQGSFNPGNTRSSTASYRSSFSVHDGGQAIGGIAPPVSRAAAARG